jgi:hypothetical protein
MDSKSGGRRWGGREDKRNTVHPCLKRTELVQWPPLVLILGISPMRSWPLKKGGKKSILLARRVGFFFFRERGNLLSHLECVGGWWWKLETVPPNANTKEKEESRVTFSPVVAMNPPISLPPFCVWMDGRNVEWAPRLVDLNCKWLSYPSSSLSAGWLLPAFFLGSCNNRSRGREPKERARWV